MSGKEISSDNKTIRATVNITNSGKYSGEEVVQLYVRDLVGSVTRPVKELKGFQKIKLEPGENKEISFEIQEEMLHYLKRDMTVGVENGEFSVFIGGSSDTENKANFMLVK